MKAEMWWSRGKVSAFGARYPNSISTHGKFVIHSKGTHSKESDILLTDQQWNGWYLWQLCGGIK